MKELNTGIDKFVIIDRLVFFSALILTIVVATATTTHPYQSKTTLDNPAELLSFEHLLNDNPEVPVAGDTEEKAAEETPEQATKEDTEIKKSPSEFEETPSASEPQPEKSHSTLTRAYRTTNQPNITPSNSTPEKPATKTIDWDIIHIDDNGENFDNGEVPGAITPSGSEFPIQPTPVPAEAPAEQPGQPEQQPEQPKTPETSETTNDE